MNASYKNILKATTLFGSVQGLNILINLVRTKLVAIILGPEGMGLNSIYNEVRELIHTSSNFGLDTSGVRGISQAYERSIDNSLTDAERSAASNKLSSQVSLLRSWVLLLAMLGSLLCMLLAAPLSVFTFGDYSHQWHFVILSPAVAFSTITCGEMAVLKGLRRLKTLAMVSVLNVFMALAITVPLYYLWGMNGVLPAILAFTAASTLLTIIYGARAHRLSFSFSPTHLKSGKAMLAIGIVVVVSEGLGHLVTLAIQAYLNNAASLEAVGFYKAGYTLTMTYGGMVFAAMSTDYFPRLSGVKDDVTKRNAMVVAQTRVTLMLIAPLLLAFILLMPYIVPLLLDGDFSVIVPMTQIAAIGLLFRAIVLSINFLPLAMGHSKVYFLLNMVGALDMLVVIPGYVYGGLTGAGIALTVQNLIDMLISIIVARRRYGIKLI